MSYNKEKQLRSTFHLGEESRQRIEIHKKSCIPKSPKSVKVNAAAEAARRAPDPALLKQDYLLADNPGVEYVIVMPSGNKDTGVQMGHPMGKAMFKFCRKMAPTTPAAVYRMYDILANSHPGLENVVQKQLMAEYGVDPLSDVAKNGKMPEMAKEDIAQAMQSMF